jgi:hypothetical protein
MELLGEEDVLASRDESLVCVMSRFANNVVVNFW